MSSRNDGTFDWYFRSQWRQLCDGEFAVVIYNIRCVESYLFITLPFEFLILSVRFQGKRLRITT